MAKAGLRPEDHVQGQDRGIIKTEVGLEVGVTIVGLLLEAVATTVIKKELLREVAVGVEAIMMRGGPGRGVARLVVVEGGSDNYYLIPLILI